jgi:acyl-CoA synthetase (NDP forming)
VDEVLTSSPAGRWLDADEAVTLLEAYGIATPRTGVAGSARQATLVARSIGYPVVAKVADPNVVHKTDLGLVAVGLASGAELNRAYRRFAAVLGHQRPSIVVQQQVAAGVELAVGAVRDATFGPLVMVAAGGITIDVLDDRAFVLLPVTPQDAQRAVGSLRTAPLLHGFRGAPPGDVAGLEELLVRVGRLAADIPEMSEMDLNPVVVTPTGVTCVDAKIRLQPYQGVDDAARPAMRLPV